MEIKTKVVEYGDIVVEIKRYTIGDQLDLMSIAGISPDGEIKNLSKEYFIKAIIKGVKRLSIAGKDVEVNEENISELDAEVGFKLFRDIQEFNKPSFFEEKR